MKRGDNRLKSVTMADIASALGISNVTVSNALAGKKGVSSSLRAEVLLKARELGYRVAEEESEEIPQPAIRQEGDIGIIALKHCMDGSTYHWQLYQELIRELKGFDRYAILDVVSDEDENNLRLPRIIEDHLASGLIMLGRPGLKFLGEISKWGLPMVFLDFSIRDFDFASITGDDYYDMYRLTSFLISHGHSNIRYVAENAEEIERDRYFGYCRAMSENEMEISVPHTARQITESDPSGNNTAFVCENRALAQRVIKDLKEISVSVPETVSVACFSETKATDGTDITCICRDISQMARVAVDALRRSMANEAEAKAKGQNKVKGLIGRISVGGRLIIGSTTKSRLI